MSTSSLHAEISRLREENSRLMHLLSQHNISHSSGGSTTLVQLHYIYASPLVLLDNLGTTVIETFDPLRVDTEFRRISESVDGRATISVATPSNLLQLKHHLEDTLAFTILHASFHTVELQSAGGKILRCALEDETGKCYLMNPDEFCESIGREIDLLFLNSCKSREIGETFLRTTDRLSHVICLGAEEPVLESTALVFASEFYPALLTQKNSVREAFERGKHAVKTSPNHRVAKQVALFNLLQRSTEPTLLFHSPIRFPSPSIPGPVGQSPSSLSSAPFWIGHMEDTNACEDFVGRQVDMVRLCGVMFSGRRVCAISGVEGIGKNMFLGETAKFLGAPGGRLFSGGVCVVRLGASSQFIKQLSNGVKQTLIQLRNWYGSVHHDKPATSPTETDHVSYTDLKSYKVFWADTFSGASDLANFLSSYQLHLSTESVGRLFQELRSNGTQLQDWGSGKIVRVVHVIRCLVSMPGVDGKYLLERKKIELSLLSKKFDPVTENILEVAALAVKKELGDEAIVSRVVLRNRKPKIEQMTSSPSYPGLSTKYSLYTADVTVTGGLPDCAFRTTEESSRKSHAWEWVSPSDSDLLREVIKDIDIPSTPLEMQLLQNSKAAPIFHSAGESEQKECLNLFREWAGLVESISRGPCGGLAASGLFLLHAEEHMKTESVRQLLGNALTRHPLLKILFSCTDGDFASFPTPSGGHKVVHVPLPPLQPLDAAVLFTRRIRRPLYPRDWWVDEDAVPPPPDCSFPEPEIDDTVPLEMSTRTSKGVANLARLARHPLLLSADGLPAKILAVAHRVKADIYSINDLLNIVSID